MNATPKQKKTLKIVWGIVIALVVIFIALAVGLGSQEGAGQAADMTPEQIKAAADTNDLDIARAVWSAQKYEANLAEKIQSMGTGETDLTDVYSYAGETKDFAGTLLTRVKEVAGMDSEAAQGYQTAAQNYISTVYMIASDIQEYIGKNEQSTLDAVQANLQVIPTAEAQFVDARAAYLTEAGFTDDEIAARPTIETD